MRWAGTSLVVFGLSALAQTPAFPGAEGFGAVAAGGRGGSVYHVINLNNSGAGSLRTGVATGNRTIVFDVSGTIELTSDLIINKPNITIAGQTAPGDGICLKGRLTSVQNTHDVIVRYIRCRPGDVGCTNFQDDAFHFVNATNSIADHVSASWSIDECLSCTWSTNITVQWCIIGASLKCSCHIKGCHGYGTLLRYGAGRESFHHNLYVHNESRNPRPGDNNHVDFVNNVIYNWGGTAGYNADDTADNPGGFTNGLNYINNYLIAGPSTSGNFTTAFDSGTASAASCEIYQSGNLIDGDRDGILDGVNTGFGMFAAPYTQKLAPFAAPPVTTDSAPSAYERVVAFVGASSVRDAVDLQIADNVRRQTGSIINSQTQQGGWPILNSITAPADTDQDGIPNYWEAAMGWNAGVANNNHFNADGYTDLEWYLNWLAAAHAVCDRNGGLDVNLQSFVGGSTNLTFTVASGTNGTVTLLVDGYTAHFTATNNFNGLATFAFNATNPVAGVGFGPVTASVLISITNAVNNTPPALSAVPDRTVIAGETVTFTNTASDVDQPPQTITFSLLDAPVNAAVGPSNGVFTWRPAMAQSPTTNTLSVIATDNGIPVQSATQSFTLFVTRPAQPGVQPLAFTNGAFGLQINGDAGPDYSIQASTNLVDWDNFFWTNSPVPPFIWLDANTADSDRRFYRVLLGP